MYASTDFSGPKKAKAMAADFTEIIETAIGKTDRLIRSFIGRSNYGVDGCAFAGVNTGGRRSSKLLCSFATEPGRRENNAN